MQDGHAAALIEAALDRVNASLKPSARVRKAPDLVLAGDHAELESLAFVAFLAALEEGIARACGTDLDLADVIFGSDRDGWTVKDLTEVLADALPSGHPVRS